MDFHEKPNLEELRRERENQAHLHNRYHARFLVSTIAMILVGIVLFLNQGKLTEKPEPTQHDLEIAETLTTIEGRESAINKKYSGTKITAERTYGKDIISVFEADDMYSFCIFEAIEEGYWMEYCGSLFPKAEMVKGTVYLADNTHKYDIYLQNETVYSHLLVTRTNRKYHKLKQEQNVHFDENGIGIMKLDSGRYYPNPRIIAYDAEGNQYILNDGGLF